MATGPEHYRKAEELLADITYDDGSIDSSGEVYAAAAQVHATLALAAALGTYGTDETRTSDDIAEWERVAGEHTRQSARRRAAEARERAEEQAARDAEAAESFVDALDDGTPVTFTMNGPGDYTATAEIEHDPRSCTECVDQYEAEQREDAEAEAAQEAWIAQGERAVDEALDARDAESGS